jgi:hypothetical protein
VVRHLALGLGDASLWSPIDEAANELVGREQEARRLAGGYRILPVDRPSADVPACTSIAFVDATESHARYDKTLLLLLGQERAPVAVLRDRDTLTLAAGFESGINFLKMLGLSGGMPTIVSVHHDRLTEILGLLGVAHGGVHLV